jgi:hypothetical protein
MDPNEMARLKGSFSARDIHLDTFMSEKTPVEGLRREPQEGHNHENHHPEG